jgi:hypothetical protein
MEPALFNWLKNEGLEPTLSNEKLKNSNDRFKKKGLEQTM